MIDQVHRHDDDGLSANAKPFRPSNQGGAPAVDDIPQDGYKTPVVVCIVFYGCGRGPGCLAGASPWLLVVGWLRLGRSTEAVRYV